MAKVNEDFFNQLRFTVTSRPHPFADNAVKHKISCMYNGIYRQFEFHSGEGTRVHKQEHIDALIIEGKYVIASEIQEQLKAKF